MTNAITENPSNFTVSAASHTDKGRVRPANEDSFIILDLGSVDSTDRVTEMTDHPCDAPGLLLAVSDGMGGAQAGEVASRLAVEELARQLRGSFRVDQRLDQLREAIQAANHRIRAAALENPSYSGMGATMTAALIQEGQAFVGQVGDSRCYLIRGGETRLVTKDQSLVQALIDVGALTEEQAAQSSQRHVILQALGSKDEIKPVVSVLSLERGDHLLLCSDYFAGKVNTAEMHDIVRKAHTLSAACVQMVELANQRGGEDNITAVLARLD